MTALFECASAQLSKAVSVTICYIGIFFHSPVGEDRPFMRMILVTLVAVVPLKQLVSLLSRIAQHDERAFQTLYGLTRSRLQWHACRIGGSDAAAQDILQETYLAIWESAERFDGTRAAPMTWMTTIVRNKAIDYLRHERSRNFMSQEGDSIEAQQLPEIVQGPESLIERCQQAQLIEHGLSLLPPLTRRAITLAFVQDLTYPEVAKEMMIPLGTAKTWIRRGLIGLRAPCEQYNCLHQCTT